MNRTSAVPGRSNALAELPAHEVRTDIQGLRAVAVGLVLVFHLWPSLLTGGYVGVDVFFVISGFLITSHLLRHPPHELADFAAFWARRLRRLLPASLLVLVVTVIAGTLLLPGNQLANLARDAVSSVLYVENWTLALNAVDYLGADQAPSPLQHYWSLGVEEQFYLLWPFVVAFGFWVIGAAIKRPRVGAIIAIGLFALCSLVVSIVWTSHDPPFAYFATPTRLWELAAGGAVALLPSSGRAGETRQVIRALTGWVGLLLIAFAALFFTQETSFPGVAAMVPVAGAFLFLAAGSGRAWWSPGGVLSLRGVQYVGDSSYAIYLWHFPLIVLVTASLGSFPWPAKVAVAVASLALAHGTRVLVENPIRRGAWLRAAGRRTYHAALLASALAVMISLLPAAQVQHLVLVQAEQQAHNKIVNSGCEGAAALANDWCDLRGRGVTPAPAVAIDDRSEAYAQECLAERPFSEIVSCTFGEPEGVNRIALVGNSHAVQWLPALSTLAPSLDLSITTFAASRCAVSTASQVFDTDAITDGCLQWGRDVVTATASRDFDLIIVTAASDEGLVGIADESQFYAKTEGYRAVLQQWADRGQKVLVLRDTPQPQTDVVGCVAAHLTEPEACDGDRRDWLPADPLVAAAESMALGSVSILDLSYLMCGVDTCYSVIGGVLVYFDPRHVSKTFSESLAAFLSPSIQNALELR